jgi:hypothetical protein
MKMMNVWTHACIACKGIKSVFGSIVADAFQIIFGVKIHANNIFFYFFKIIFDISTSK